MIVKAVSLQRLDYLGALNARLGFRELSQLRRLKFPVQHTLQHCLPRNAKHVAQDAGQFHLGVFQCLDDPVLLAGSSSNQPLAPPRQIPQLSNFSRRYETGSHHAVPQQMRQPDTVGHVGLVPAQILHMQRIGQMHRQTPLQHVKYRLPIRSGTRHHHALASTAHYPLPHSIQFPIRGAEHLRFDHGFGMGRPIIVVTAISRFPMSIPAHRSSIAPNIASPFLRRCRHFLCKFASRAASFHSRVLLCRPDQFDIQGRTTD